MNNILVFLLCIIVMVNGMYLPQSVPQSKYQSYKSFDETSKTVSTDYNYGNYAHKKYESKIQSNSYQNQPSYYQQQKYQPSNQPQPSNAPIYEATTNPPRPVYPLYQAQPQQQYTYEQQTLVPQNQQNNQPEHHQQNEYEQQVVQQLYQPQTEPQPQYYQILNRFRQKTRNIQFCKKSSSLDSLNNWKSGLSTSQISTYLFKSNSPSKSSHNEIRENSIRQSDSKQIDICPNLLRHEDNNDFDERLENSGDDSFSDSSWNQYVDESTENSIVISDDEIEYDDMNASDNLYPNSDLSCNEFLFAMSAIKLKHNLSENAINDILSLFKLVLPEKNKSPKTLFRYEKEILKSKSAKFYEHCQKCGKLSNPIDIFDFRCLKKKCENCQIILSTFACFDIREQILSVLKDKSKLDQIVKSNLESKIMNESFCLKSPTDGKIYKSAILSSCSSDILVSLVLNTDGCPITKSKNYSLWPLLGSVLELKPSTREKFENVIILGLWLNIGKPSYNIFYEKSLEQLNEMKKVPLVLNGLSYFSK
ncbi:unnamed protein product [Brachionus calyciflorus]|uniref:Uncharacterized protein n=1 Tax=Brachionus calyciflorus TaxID=104777 RepID=A0A814EX06_9BILA|nr:unnamed protein product [Brachionus calyciflorus]